VSAGWRGLGEPSGPDFLRAAMPDPSTRQAPTDAAGDPVLPGR
jgi:hypothetical protein